LPPLGTLPTELLLGIELDDEGGGGATELELGTAEELLSTAATLDEEGGGGGATYDELLDFELDGGLVT
jgi:hypothetical protein